MPQAECSGNVAVMADRQNASRCLDPVMSYNHCAIVQRRILEENILDQTSVHFRVDYITRGGILVKRNRLFHNDQRTGIAFGHAHARIHNRHNPRQCLLIEFLPVMMKNLTQELPPPVRPQFHKEALYRFLEKDHKDNQADGHEFIQNSADNPHVENLGRKYPYDYKRKDTIKNIDGARFLHKAIDIIQQYCKQQYVEHILDSEFRHGEIL